MVLPAAVTRDSSAGKILIADPDDAARAAYRASLITDEFDVVEAADGRQALVRALMRAPATVITELRLPLLDGFALCEILREDLATSRVPLVIVTREHDRSTLDRARRVADVVLAKPAHATELIATVRHLILRKAETLAESTAASVCGDTTIARSRQLVRRHTRYQTTTPPAVPPELVCPACSGLLQYEHSFVGGVNARLTEQWDYYFCPREMIRYQYRQRTRKLRRLGDQ
jgi:CheY-like chemotaxis protein